MTPPADKEKQQDTPLLNHRRGVRGIAPKALGKALKYVHLLNLFNFQKWLCIMCSTIQF